MSNDSRRMMKNGFAFLQNRFFVCANASKEKPVNLNTNAFSGINSFPWRRRRQRADEVAIIDYQPRILSSLPGNNNQSLHFIVLSVLHICETVGPAHLLVVSKSPA